MNRIAVDGLTDNPGRYRRDAVSMLGSKHVPPPHHEVPLLVAEMCEAAEAESDSVTRAAFVLWRLNWIHGTPLTDRRMR
jgi:Fic family protein